MDEWVTKNVESMHFVFAALEDIELHCTYVVDRFAFKLFLILAQTIISLH